MQEERTPVPSYRKPPIIESVWSVQFAELAWLLPPHTGLFWNRIRQDFPNVEEQLPIAHVVESKDAFRIPQFSAEMVSAPPLARQWFVTGAGSELVQLQRDRLCCNWRKVQPEDIYPRYAHMRDFFRATWAEFCSFVSEMQQPPPAIDQCEMTYINHIDQGKGWDSAEEIGNVFRPLAWRNKTSFLQAPKTLGARMTFEVPIIRGRLHVSLRHAVKTTIGSQGKEVFLLELTARGLPEKTGALDLLEWYALARESIVRGFTDLTSETMHATWEREQ